MENNLIKDLTYRVTTGVPIEHSYLLKNNESMSGNSFTAETVAGLDYADPLWTKFYRGLNRSVTVELGDLKSVEGFSATFLQNKSAGIYTPTEVDLYVSENGIDYMLAYTVPSLVGQSESEVKYSFFTIIDGARFRARFVRLVFDVDVNVYGCKFKVFGGEVCGNEIPFVKSETVISSPAYLAPVSGFASTLLIHCGYWDSSMSYDEHYVNNTAEKLLPYVGYVSKNGKITDTMFDSVLFLYLQSKAPSGGKTVFIPGEAGSYTIKSDFDRLLDNLFEDNYNMGALDKAVETVRTALEKESMCLNVSVQLPFVYKTKAPFGDINGDGIEEGAFTAEERLAVYDYFIRECIDRFNKKGYSHLKLAAFYQGCEGVPAAMSEDEEKLFAAVNSLVHSYGKKATWIPCYLSTGFEKWKSFGFDAAYMQPNYMFQTFDRECLSEFADILKTYNLGAELEINYTSVNPLCETFETDSRKYLDYLDFGYSKGYMNAALAIYQGAGPGYLYTAAYSHDSRVRSLYRKTYKFIKRSYVPDSPEDIEEYDPEGVISAVASATVATAKRAGKATGRTVKKASKKVSGTSKKAIRIIIDEKQAILAGGIITAGAAALAFAIMLGRKFGQKK